MKNNLKKGVVLKVVILHPPFYPMNHQFFNLLGKYVKLKVYHFGEYPRLHTSWKIYDFKDKAENYNIKVFGKGAISFKTQVNPSWIQELINDKPDFVISVAFWIPSLYASLLKNIFGYKFIISTDAICETEKNLSSFRKNIRKVICKNTDGFISASDLTTEYLESLCPNVVIEKSLQTIDVNQWNKNLNNLSTKEILRKELSLPLDKTIILGVGGFTEKKNWMAVFQQMKLLNDCIFVLIGSGELEEEYKKYIEKNQLQKVVKIVGRKEGLELQKYFKVSDIFIFPSLYDQFGYVVVEALASGLPVICSENSGASSLIKDGKNGFVVNPIDDFTDKINLIIQNISTYQEEAFKTVETKTLENKTLEYVDVLKSMEK